MNRRYFTLMEVLIALAILSLGILAGTGLLSGARERSRRAEQQWLEHHAMTQAAEFFLLAGVNHEIPERIFPFPQYRVAAVLCDPANLPADVPDRKAGWRLATMVLQLRDTENTVLAELSIDRIVKTGEK